MPLLHRVFLQGLSAEMKDCLSELKPEQQEYIRQAYYLNLLPDEIAAAMGISEKEVYRLKQESVRALRSPERAKRLRKHYFDRNYE
jgi:DNA-directed RNA polymerase specialized sigma24 family protein